MTDYENLDKFLLICKPCQSGKTSLVIENIKKLIQIIDQENIHNNVSIIFCDNSLLQTEQMNKRVESENINVKIISSKSEIKNVDELYRKIINEDIKVIICCANKTQIGNIDKLLEFFNISDKKNKLNEDYNFHFFIDEVDKTFSNSFFDNIKIWEENKKITKITVITATPENFLKKMGSDKIPILPLEESYNRDTYHKIDDSIITNIEDINFNIEYILNNYEFSENSFLFCPGKVKKISHYDIQKILKELRVALLNGIICSLLILFYNLAFQDSYELALTVSLALLTVIIFASIFGTFIPMVLNQMKIDPALATGPFITTSNDLLGIVIYFSIGRLLY
jgi:hypothetical protein